MDGDSYALFTEFHRIYIRAIRRSFRERLESIFGDAWFQRGVLPALTDAQRANLSVVLDSKNYGTLEDLLDAGHLGRIVSWNHAAVFSRTFSEIDYALGQFRFLAAMRNEWAHIPTEGLRLDRVLSAIRIMQSVLVTLRCREALEMGTLMNQRSIEQSEITVDEPGSGLEETYSDEYVSDDDRLNPSTPAPLALWSGLRSYLISEAFVSADPPLNRNGEPIPEQVEVTVRVSNVAPASEDRPQISFIDVGVLTKPTQRRSRTTNWGTLDPGQTVETQFVIYDKEVAHFEYTVTGRVDLERYLNFQQTDGLPRGVVRAVLLEFNDRLAEVGIKEPIDMVVASLAVVNPAMTFVEAARVREELGRAVGIIQEKRTALSGLFSEFYLNDETTLGGQVREVMTLLERLESGVQLMDEAIGQTDLKAIQAAMDNLEQLQLSVLQMEETIRKMLTG